MTTLNLPQTKRTAEQKAKMSALKPIVERWNKCQQQTWKLTPYMGYSFLSDTVRLTAPKDQNHAHGALVTEVAGVCNAYHWTWAIYIDENGLIEINI